MGLDEVLEALHRDEPADAGHDDALAAEPQSPAKRVRRARCDLERARRRLRRARARASPEAPRRLARSRRSPLGAVTAAHRRNDQRVARPIARERSETAMSEPWRLHEEREPVAGGGACADRPVRHDPVDVDHVEPALGEHGVRLAQRRRDDDRRERVERLADSRSAFERLGEAPRRPRGHRRVAVRVVVHPVVACGPLPLAVPWEENVDFVPVRGDAPHDRLDERRRRVALVPGVRRRDREDLQRPSSSTMR